MKTSDRIRITVCLAILFALLIYPSQVKACSCVEATTIPNEFTQHEAVFIGEVIRIVDNYIPIFSSMDSIMFKFGFSPYFFFDGGKRSGFSIIFQTINSWKGIENTLVEVSTGRGGGDCGYSFTVDKEYLIYASHAYGISDNYWVTGTCSRTTELSNAADDLNYLSTLPAVSLNSTIPFLLTEKEAILYGLPLLVAGSILFVSWRRKIHKQLNT